MRRRCLLTKKGALTLSATGGTAGAYNGGYVTFTVKYNGVALKDSNVTVSSDKSWVSTTWDNSNSRVSATCDINTDLNYTRNAVITVSYDDSTANYQLTQSKGTLSISPSSASANKDGGNTTFTVIVSYAQYGGALSLSSNQTWASASNNNGVVTVSFTENTTTTSRTATITVTVQGNKKYFTLSQSNIRVITSLPYDGETDGYKYITMNGVKWAVNNVGTSFDGDYGNYYQYGKGASQYSATSGQSVYNGTENPLASSADTATQVMGNNWRMPTSAECASLTGSTTREWVKYQYNNNTIYGIIYKDSTTHYVFFPASGYWSPTDKRLYNKNTDAFVWTSTSIVYNGNNYAYRFEMISNASYSNINFRSREIGCSIRAILN